MAEWNHEQYLKFKRERTQPAFDLAARISGANPASVLDIGCGSGNSTRVLKSIFPAARIIGADNSENMLEKAQRDNPDIEFMYLDASSGLDTFDERFDIVFSNACIQWIDNHPKLIGEMMGLLTDGGTLAVQAPINSKEPLMKLIDETAAEWNIKSAEHNDMLPTEDYFDILSGLTSDFDIWETVYCHRMPNHESLIEWVKGTRLRPYLAALDSDRARLFERELLQKAQAAYPVRENGEIIFKFRRLFFTAVKQIVTQS